MLLCSFGRYVGCDDIWNNIKCQTHCKVLGWFLLMICVVVLAFCGYCWFFVVTVVVVAGVCVCVCVCV